jgi:hypothetical protein
MLARRIATTAPNAEQGSYPDSTFPSRGANDPAHSLHDFHHRKRHAGTRRPIMGPARKALRPDFIAQANASAIRTGFPSKPHSISGRPRTEQRKTKKVILSEFCANTGYHLSMLIRLLNGPPPEKQRTPRQRRRGLNLPPRNAGSFDRGVGGRRLSLVGAAEGAVTPVDAVDPQTVRFAAGDRKVIAEDQSRQMDRRLKAQKTQRRRRLYGRTKPAYLLKHHIPVKTDRWDVRVPVSRKRIWFRILAIPLAESLHTP